MISGIENQPSSSRYYASRQQKERMMSYQVFSLRTIVALPLGFLVVSCTSVEPSPFSNFSAKKAADTSGATTGGSSDTATATATATLTVSGSGSPNASQISQLCSNPSFPTTKAGKILCTQNSPPLVFNTQPIPPSLGGLPATVGSGGPTLSASGLLLPTPLPVPVSSGGVVIGKSTLVTGPILPPPTQPKAVASAPPPAAPQSCGILYPNQTLTGDQYVTSCDGASTFVLQASDGNLVLYHSGYAVWDTMSRCGATGDLLAMQGDGNLVLYQNGAATWSTNTWDYPGSLLVVQGDGNIVVYLGSSVADGFPPDEARWSRFTNNPCGVQR